MNCCSELPVVGWAPRALPQTSLSSSFHNSEIRRFLCSLVLILMCTKVSWSSWSSLLCSKYPSILLLTKFALYGANASSRFATKIPTSVTDAFLIEAMFPIFVLKLVVHFKTKQLHISYTNTSFISNNKHLFNERKMSIFAFTNESFFHPLRECV